MLIVLFFLAATANEEGDAGLEPNLRRCCDVGKRWAEEEEGQCDNFPVPVPDIAVKLQTMCIAAVEMCCADLRRRNQCRLGTVVSSSYVRSIWIVALKSILILNLFLFF